MRLRSGLPILWRDATQVQVGTDPRWAVVLTDLSPAASRALCTVPPGADAEVLRSTLLDEGADTDEIGAVLDQLHAARLLVDAPSHPDAPDVSAWSALAEDGDGAAVLAHRAEATVRFEGLGRIGAATAGLVATAGIGTVELCDPAVVRLTDIGFGGLAVRDVGTARTAAVARALHDAAPRVRTITLPASEAPDGEQRRPPPTLTVLVDQGVADPVRHHRLTETDQPHLSVVAREASVLVGPLVLPGCTACLHCLDLHRTDLDPLWPQVATQLSARGLARGLFGTDGVGRVGPETSVAAAAAALAAAAVLAYVDGRPTELTGASLEVALPGVTVGRRAWSPHTGCGCHPPSEPGPAPSPTP